MTLESPQISRNRVIMSFLGTLMLIYVVVALGYTATCPDLRLRFLLVEDSPADDSGILIRAIDQQPTSVLEEATPFAKAPFFLEVEPEKGDRLVRVRNREIRNFFDYADALCDLHFARTPREGMVSVEYLDNPTSSPYAPKLIQFETDQGEHSRYVEVGLLQSDGASNNSFLLIQSVPFNEMVWLIVWVLVQIGIFAVAALAFWYRPFDSSSHLFYAMTICMLGASVGAFYWWVICTRFWLLVPFVICATSLPAVALHFFLVYPQPKLVLRIWPKTILTMLYFLPAVSTVVMLSLWGYSYWLNSIATTAADASRVIELLQLIRSAIYGYVAIAAVYFLFTIVALATSFSSTRNPLQKYQVRWILGAGLLSTIMLAWALYLAGFEQEGFALGAARKPILLASGAFMIAYAVSIVRYKLSLINEIINRSALYYLSSIVLTGIFSLGVALTGQLDKILGISLLDGQTWSITVIVMLVIIMMLWLRDRSQQMIDQRFFREKYQLDKALRRMNQMMDRVVEPHSVTELMMSMIVEVLDVKDAAIYLCNAQQKSFRLVGAEGTADRRLQFQPDPEVIESLTNGGSVQRILTVSRNEMTPAQAFLRDHQAHLIHLIDLGRDGKALVVLGPKRNSSSFTAEDLTFIEALAQISNIALQGAKLHQNMVRLNDEMKMKVDKISTQDHQIAMLQAELEINQAKPEIATVEAKPEDDSFKRDAFIGNSPATLRVLDSVRKIAQSDSTVLIGGQSGTGKELLAKVVHENSDRKDKPLVSVHCAALSAGLLESELFGHVKGAFTGAHRDKVGRFEAAHGGTLFLDEIGDISMENQIKLLRVLQERKFERVGGTKTIEVDVRLITATHQDLEKLIAEGKFRQDLYYRLNVVSMTLPPLHERREDIYELAHHFLKRSAEKTGKEVTGFEQAALNRMMHYRWPGNIRELENVVERAVVMTDGNVISLADLPQAVREASPFQRPLETVSPNRLDSEMSPNPIVLPTGDRGGSFVTPPVNREQMKKQNASIEREQLFAALEQTGGNKAEAARLLGMPRSTFYSKLKKFS